jgi:GNAT superfamily N-acetyltransferase
MNFRLATSDDIPQIQIIRNSVKENMLSNPALISDNDVEEFINLRGRGWVCEINDRIVGFAIADLKENNIWALFIHPDNEGIGIGNILQKLMLDWYFEQGKQTVWLSTSPDTRAEKFYRKSGWTETGKHGEKEIKFEMTSADWKIRNSEN